MVLGHDRRSIEETINLAGQQKQRPRGSSDIDYLENDAWRLGDMVPRLRLERGAPVLDTDYVRGRMIKTQVTVGPDGRFVVETRNRHEMAVRCLRALKGAGPHRREGIALSAVVSRRVPAAFISIEVVDGGPDGLEAFFMRMTSLEVSSQACSFVTQ